ncbi:MAG: response regulator transcription factor [Chthoniobacterales bacterium]
MKHGKKAVASKSSAKRSADSALPFVIIPFPPGLSSVVAEEPPSVPQLTPREIEVVAWVAEGKTDTEIARILGRGLQTVKTHVKSLLDEIKVENRNAVTAWVWRNRFAAEFYQRGKGKPVKYS